MTASEHARRALALYAVREGLEPFAHVASAVTVAFVAVGFFHPPDRWLASIPGLVAVGLVLIRHGLRRRADHHELAAEYLDAAPPRRDPKRAREWGPPPPPPEAA